VRAAALESRVVQKAQLLTVLINHILS